MLQTEVSSSISPLPTQIPAWFSLTCTRILCRSICWNSEYPSHSFLSTNLSLFPQKDAIFRFTNCHFTFNMAATFKSGAVSYFIAPFPKIRKKTWTTLPLKYFSLIFFLLQINYIFVRLSVTGFLVGVALLVGHSTGQLVLDSGAVLRC